MFDDGVDDRTGWGQSMIPRRDDKAVKSCLGSDIASGLLPIINALAEDYNSTNARSVAADLETESDNSIVNSFLTNLRPGFLSFGNNCKTRRNWLYMIHRWQGAS